MNQLLPGSFAGHATAGYRELVCVGPDRRVGVAAAGEQESTPADRDFGKESV